MSAYGTAKMPTTDLNVGFPRAFSQNYARFGPQKEYYPETEGTIALPIGDDFQAIWHEQKRKDADYMAQSKVKATHSHNARAFSSPHGYFNIPPPQLGQRKFANTSLGALYTHSTREDQPSENAPFVEIPNGANPYQTQYRQNEGVSSVHLTGGVLRTSAGQRHGIATLNARIQQLNAINDAKQNFLTEGNNANNQVIPTPFAGAAPQEDALLSGSPLIELSNILQSLKFSLIQSFDYGDDVTNVNQDTVSGRSVFSDMNRALPFIIRMATNNPPEDIANVLEFIEGTSSNDGIVQLLQGRVDTLTNAGAEAEGDVEIMGEDAEDIANASVLARPAAVRRATQRLTVLLEYWNRVNEYLKEMLKIAKGGNVPLKDREAASKTLIKSLGFTKLNKQIAKVYVTNEVPLNAFVSPTGNIANFNNAQRAVELGGNDEYDELVRDIDETIGKAKAKGSGKFVAPKGTKKTLTSDESKRSLRKAQNTFSRSAPTREDSQQGSILALSNARQQLQEADAVRDAYAFGSGEYQDNTGGRPRAWIGEIPLAEYGTSSANMADVQNQRAINQQAEQEAQEQSMRAFQDPETGEWNLLPHSESEEAEEASKKEKKMEGNGKRRSRKPKA